MVRNYLAQSNQARRCILHRTHHYFMYLSKLTIENFRCFGESENKMEVSFTPGLTTLVGANDAGKTAIIDALRLALGTSDQDRHRLEDSDFHGATREIRIICKFEQLDAEDQATFTEYLSYGDNTGDPPKLYYNWSAEDTGETRKGRPYRRVDVCSGKDGTGPTIAPEVRLLMQATYLRPLRDAEEALSAGRGSRLAQVLRQSTLVKTGAHAHDATLPLPSRRTPKCARAATRFAAPSAGDRSPRPPVVGCQPPVIQSSETAELVGGPKTNRTF